MAITDWPADERPRERLLTQGAAALSDAELLAIFLRVGVKGKSAVDLARDLINRFGSLNRLFSATQADFSQVPGMGPAKYVQLQAVLEMSRRALAEEMTQREAFASPGAVRDYLRLHLASLQHEVFFALSLVGYAVSVDCGRSALSRHADTEQRLSTRSRQKSAGTQCGGGRVGA